MPPPASTHRPGLPCSDGTIHTISILLPLGSLTIITILNILLLGCLPSDPA